MRKIISVIGARPQFIKEFPINNQIKNFKNLKEVIVHTGQHYDYEMSKIFFEELKLPEPDYHLEVGSSTHGKQTGLMLSKLEEVYLREKPDIVFVYGDTNTTLAGALAAVKLEIPVAHIEAGLRSFNKSMPEEINRVLTDHISSYLFCPTKSAVENLKKEGIFGRKKVFLVGDVMEEAINLVLALIEKKKGILKELDLKEKNYLLSTIHRAENTDNKERLEKIFNILNELSKDFKVIFPIHPRTEKQIKFFGIKPAKEIKIVKPLSYLNMLCLEKNSYAILTDSGGVQKEAFWFSVPCFVLRKETEWVETLKEGKNFVVDLNMEKIRKYLFKIINTVPKTKKLDTSVSNRIIKTII